MKHTTKSKLHENKLTKKTENCIKEKQHVKSIQTQHMWAHINNKAILHYNDETNFMTKLWKHQTKIMNQS